MGRARPAPSRSSPPSSDRTVPLLEAFRPDRACAAPIEIRWRRESAASGNHASPYQRRPVKRHAAPRNLDRAQMHTTRAGMASHGFVQLVLVPLCGARSTLIDLDTMDLAGLAGAVQVDFCGLAWAGTWVLSPAVQIQPKGRTNTRAVGAPVRAAGLSWPGATRSHRTPGARRCSIWARSPPHRQGVLHHHPRTRRSSWPRSESAPHAGCYGQFQATLDHNRC